MKELSLHILDLAQNSLVAGATLVEISLLEDTCENQLTIVLGDNGHGMDADFLSRVTDPFTTTRTTRKVGMGLPLMKQTMQIAGGDLQIDSRKGEGTTLHAWCQLDHIDRLPLGDVIGTVYMLIIMNPDIDFLFTARIDETEFILDTRSMRQVLGDVPLNNPDVAQFIKSFLTEGMAELPFID